MSKKDGISRRRFLINAGAGAAGIGAATLGITEVQAKNLSIDRPQAGRSIIGAVRIRPELSYMAVPDLLYQFIQNNDEKVWDKIIQRINYTYRCLGPALHPIVKKRRIVTEIKAGKKLFFKPNLVNPEFLSLKGDGSPGVGLVCVTDWAFIAALMRFFHDKYKIYYYQMALGEAGTAMPAYSSLLGCTPEALIEGTPFGVDFGYYAGWGMYWIRKYLSNTTTPYDKFDDPMNGYEDSITGNYVTPGQATSDGKLMVYDLNNAESFPIGQESFSRGRIVKVPDGGHNYKDGIIIHKALVGSSDNPGNPDDPAPYPGCVLVNVPILKVHGFTTLTNAIKNIGIGGWPMESGQDENEDTADWLYAYPPDHPPGCKGGVPGWKDGYPWKGKGVYHDRWYVVDANEQGMPLKITETPNYGLDGTMVDINLAIASQVPNMLNIVEAVKTINLEHWTGLGESVNEGLIFASTDPLALDLMCARYLFKNIPMDPRQPELFARGVPLPKYDENSRSIITELGAETRISQSTLFDYAAKRGLGNLDYYIVGKDKTTVVPKLMLSKHGHLGRIEHGRFREIMTDTLYFHVQNGLWDLQATALSLAIATDDLSGSEYHAELMAQLDENGDGVIDDGERGKNGMLDCVVAAGAVAYNFVGKGHVAQGVFTMYSRVAKYSNPDWNIGRNVDSTKFFVMAMAIPVALELANGPDTDATGKPNIDPFFNIPFGTGEDGIAKWPSLQFAIYSVEMSVIYDYLYTNAMAHPEGKSFVLYVPEVVPHTPNNQKSNAHLNYNPNDLDNVVSISDPEKVFTAEFEDQEIW